MPACKPPTVCNPEFDHRAYDWSILATYDTIIAGKYDDGSTRDEIKSFRLTAYQIRKSKGNPSPNEVERAKKLIQERD